MSDVLDQNSVLKLEELFIRPKHRQVCEVYDIDEGLPKTGLSFGVLVPEPKDHAQVLMVVVILEYSRVLFVDLIDLRRPFANVLVCNEQAPGYVAESRHGWNVSGGAHPHQMTMLAKRDRVLHRRVENAVLAAPLPEPLILGHRLQLARLLPVHLMMNVFIVRIIEEVGHIARPEAQNVQLV